MANGKSTYNVEIKTAADLKAAEAYKRAIENAQKAAKGAGQESVVLTQKLQAVDNALQSNAARAIRLEENLKRVTNAQKSLNAEMAKSRGNGISLSHGMGSGLADVAALNQQLKDGAGGGVYGALGGGLMGLGKGALGGLAGAAAGVASVAFAYKQVSASVREYAETED